MKLRKLFPVFSCFILLFVLLGISGCFGDDVTLKDCGNNITVNVTEGEECPAPPPPPPPTTPTTPTTPTEPTEPEPGAGSGECNLFADGKVPLNGSSGDDVICGDDDNNTINALSGEDVVRAGGGDDIVDGGEHDDEIYGEAGNDVLNGGEGEDTLDGGPGNDILTGGEDDDELIGGDGSDTVRYIGCRAFDDAGACTTPDPLTINLAQGFSLDEYGDQDSYVSIENVVTGPGDDAITGDGNANRIDGGGGQTPAGMLLDGGDGIDTLVVGEPTVLNGATGPNNANFENLEARATVNASLDLTGDSKVNVIKGGNNGGTLSGMGGNDRLVAGTGGSTLQGGPGDDTLVGGAGVDNLIGGIGRDTLTGNEGNDCFLVEVEDPVVTDRITDFGEGDSISTTGTAPAGLAQEGGTLAVVARGGNIVVTETYDHDNDAATDDRVVNRATVATVGRALADGATLGSNCP